MDMQVNNEVSLNNEQEKNMKENSGIIEKTEKQKVMKDGKQRRDVIRYFLPVLTTIGWVIIYTIGQNSDVFVVFGFVLVCIGLLSAITVSPLQ